MKKLAHKGGTKAAHKRSSNPAAVDGGTGSVGEDWNGGGEPQNQGLAAGLIAARWRRMALVEEDSEGSGEDGRRRSWWVRTATGGGEDGSGGGSWWRTAMAVVRRMARASGRNDGGGYAGRSGESKAARWGRMMMAVVRMAARIDGSGSGAAVASLAVVSLAVGRRWRR
ncbi:hypothetical protein OsJ_06526 [Oryza sativa Japonica Group]|uniref:Uncharacterized protein n=2 Tax=Oryza sativa subsp. japonica TaxID=39947 RepID=Q6ZFQ2_ORYSJ|nr:hypothetical protein OsJ_06526 [Oryza sativa Japonica Group]BAD15600.1 hypothetical protein [Oryza sativa Japonica Group]